MGPVKPDGMAEKGGQQKQVQRVIGESTEFSPPNDKNDWRRTGMDGMEVTEWTRYEGRWNGRGDQNATRLEFTASVHSASVHSRCNKARVSPRISSAFLLPECLCTAPGTFVLPLYLYGLSPQLHLPLYYPLYCPAFILPFVLPFVPPCHCAALCIALPLCCPAFVLPCLCATLPLCCPKLHLPLYCPCTLER